jgi:hypothetical protein
LEPRVSIREAKPRIWPTSGVEDLANKRSRQSAAVFAAEIKESFQFPFALIPQERNVIFPKPGGVTE